MSTSEHDLRFLKNKSVWKSVENSIPKKQKNKSKNKKKHHSDSDLL